jgi:uncharacterized membrane protein YbjE (DUF340 family)
MSNKPHLRPHQEKRQASQTTRLLVAILIIAIFALAIALEATGHIVFRGRLRIALISQFVVTVNGMIAAQLQFFADRNSAVVPVQRPVVPSTCSRRMSACPACRAVSLVMWAMTHRRVCRLPSTGTAKRACGSPTARVARSLSAMAAR